MALAATDFQLLANAGFPPAKFEPGQVIFSEGDKGNKMYVIRSGEVEVERDGKIVETLSGGGIFGEMALIDGSPRAATARAKTACEVAPITEKSFLFLVHETPYFAVAVMRTLHDGVLVVPGKTRALVVVAAHLHSRTPRSNSRERDRQ